MSGAKESDERRYPWWVLTVTSTGVLLVSLNNSTLVVALPVVVRHFDAGPFAANWMLLSYMLVNTGLTLVFGRLADIFGRRKIYLLGFGIFTLASLLLGFSPGVWALISLRVIQAIGAAMIVANSTVLITDAFPPHLLGRAFGINAMTLSSGQLLGPTLGGFLASVFGWRAVFWFNVPVGLISILWGLHTLRRGASGPRRERIDVPGALVYLLGFSSLLLALSQGGVWGWKSPAVSAGLIVFAILFPVFLYIEYRASSPMLELGLFKNRPYTMANVAAFVNSLTRYAVVLLMVLFFQTAQGDDAFAAGLKILPVALSMLVVSPIAGALIGRYDLRVLSTMGLAVTGAGLLGLIISLSATTPYTLTVVNLSLIGIGSGLFMPSNTSAIMTSVPPYRRGVANGVRSTLQNTGRVFSTALSLAIVTSVLSPDIKNAVYSGGASNFSAENLDQLVFGYQAAFLVMLAATALGIVASSMRGKQQQPNLIP